jgi:hypothetical protein
VLDGLAAAQGLALYDEVVADALARPGVLRWSTPVEEHFGAVLSHVEGRRAELEAGLFMRAWRGHVIWHGSLLQWHSEIRSTDHGGDACET